MGLGLVRLRLSLVSSCLAPVLTVLRSGLFQLPK